MNYQFEELIIIRGGGDIATGIIQKFYRSGFPVLVLETKSPTTIRRNVALSEAVYEGTVSVEDMVARRVEHLEDVASCHADGEIPILIDPAGESISKLSPACVIDSIIAKRNLGTVRSMAPATIAIGPGFTAGEDVDIVIESMRGHNLGRLIFEGTALPNTGTPGLVGGKSAERVIHAPVNGIVRHERKLGDVIEKDDVVFYIDDTPVTAPFTGLLRGLIREGHNVKKGLKSADIDPRTDVEWNSISDKARSLGGAALEAYFYLRQKESGV